MHRVALLAASALAISACTSPEDQPPVALQPGLYEVALGGGTLVELTSGERTSQVCLDETEAHYFPSDPLAPLIERWENCAFEAQPRKGNAIAGARQCDQRAMPMRASYTGSLATDSFELNGEVTQSNDEGGGVMHLGSGEFSLTGKRIGDCTA